MGCCAAARSKNKMITNLWSSTDVILLEVLITPSTCTFFLPFGSSATTRRKRLQHNEENTLFTFFAVFTTRIFASYLEIVVGITTQGISLCWVEDKQTHLQYANKKKFFKVPLSEPLKSYGHNIYRILITFFFLLRSSQIFVSGASW